MTEQILNAAMQDEEPGKDRRHGPKHIKDFLSRPPIKRRPDASTTVVVEKCKLCHDKKWFGYFVNPGEPHFGEVYPCRNCNGGNDPKTLHAISGLSDHEQQWRLTDLDTEGRPAVQRLEQACRELIGGRRYILTVWGAFGNGKTLALQAVVNEMNERRVQAMYYTTKQLLDNLRAAYGKSSDEAREGLERRLDSLVEVPYLALDEFDKVSLTDWAMEQLTYIIDRRHRASEAGTHATLIAMNTDPALQEAWIASRLLARGNLVIHLDGPDLRPYVGGDEDGGNDDHPARP